MEAPVDWRALAVLVCASAAVTALGSAVYRRDPGRRKAFVALSCAVLLLAPWWSAAGFWTIPVGVADPALGGLAHPVPWVLLAIWWGVGCLLMLRTGARVWRGRRGLEALPRLNDTELVRCCRRWAAALGVPRTVSLRRGAGPCASSLGGPVLVLPETAQQWDDATRDAVVCHELSHLKRLDDRLLLLVRLVADWYWWMPWLAQVRRRYLHAMEESCDDLASSALGSREAYVRGVLQAARSLTPSAVTPRPGTWPAWVEMLGHSHLAARVERLVVAPRPSLRTADGRWTLFWVSLALIVGLTARPAARPGLLTDRSGVIPISSRIPGQAPATSTVRPARVETASFLGHPGTGEWRPVPGSARDPLPVYPAAALERGVAGLVTVEVPLRITRDGAIAAAPPEVSSSDPTGLLAAAVQRALARTGVAGLGAGLRAVSAHDNNLKPPPGTQLRLRKTYRFVPGTATPGASEPDQEVIP